MKRIATVVVGLALLTVPSAALASSSTCQAYNTQTCDVSAITQSRTPSSTVQSTNQTTTTSASSASLPFTGLDVGLLVVGGAALLGCGLFVRRISRNIS